MKMGIHRKECVIFVINVFAFISSKTTVESSLKLEENSLVHQDFFPQRHKHSG